MREAVRASHPRMVVARLHRALIRLQPRYLPQSPLGQALGYARNQWPVLDRILAHGEVELDNNLVENAIRPTALGKKNWRFFSSAEAGQRSAVMYTLMANCRRHGVEPYAYLKDVLTRLPRTTPGSGPTDTAPLESRPAVPPSHWPPEVPSAPKPTAHPITIRALA